MSNETVTFQEVFEQLENEQSQAKEVPEIGSWLPLESVHQALELFQPRDLGTDTGSKEQHIRTLMDAIYSESGNRLDPVVVWWSGLRWFVLDGHHRLEAYKRVNDHGRVKINQIPVKIFEGDLVAAMSEATRLNSKDKLAMTKDDKYNRAWLFVAMDRGLSKREISKICKIGSATVARMRSKLKEIQELHHNDWLGVCTEMKWYEARNYPHRDRVIDDEWTQRQAKEWAERLARTFGKKPCSQPEIFADALEMYSKRLFDALVDYLKDCDFEENPDF